ncbi:hypothetical protein B0H17DRAFT_1198929 [Mycena rosella]|uniref:Uncharacterized protein n=1 Tax=Mycena rosella TaxID=1033263 RepID=A0AAD7DLS1_MYCRO|nr:hypothetical protein B0H17DRAFT_1198929 [Mycena rosella]
MQHQFTIGEARLRAWASATAASVPRCALHTLFDARPLHRRAAARARPTAGSRHLPRVPCPPVLSLAYRTCIASRAVRCSPVSNPLVRPHARASPPHVNTPPRTPLVGPQSLRSASTPPARCSRSARSPPLLLKFEPGVVVRGFSSGLCPATLTPAFHTHAPPPPLLRRYTPAAPPRIPRRCRGCAPQLRLARIPVCAEESSLVASLLARAGAGRAPPLPHVPLIRIPSASPDTPATPVSSLSPSLAVSYKIPPPARVPTPMCVHRLCAIAIAYPAARLPAVTASTSHASHEPFDSREF